MSAADVTVILFLCTGNSARSILAEALANHLGGGHLRGLSAGSHPTGRVNPLAIETLEALGIPTVGLRSKSWDEFAAPDAQRVDLVITVCDNAANEACPVWPGRPAMAHWGLPDPAAVRGTEAEKRKAFRETAGILERRIACLAALPLASLDRATLQRQLAALATAP
jgi:arsenate reductase